MSTERTPWSEEFTAAERVEMVTTSLDQPRTTNWIANRATVAHGTAAKYLEQLERDGKVSADTSSQQTTYYPDPVSQYLQEIRDLYVSHSTEELTQSLEDIVEQITAWKAEYDVDSANGLRVKLGDIEDQSERKELRTVITKWNNLEERKEIIWGVLKISDQMPDRPDASVRS